MAAPTLEVIIKAKDEASKAIGGIQTKMGGLGSSIQKNHKAIGMGMTAMGGAILAAGALSIKTYAQMGDEVQKMALRTGFATTTLSELRHAAELSGSSLTSIEKGVKKMAKSLIDADRGLETYKRSFDELGLSTTDLLALKPEEQFWAITEALADVEDMTLKSALAQEIFGRAGTELLPMLAAGSEGIAKMREEAHTLGIVFDQEAANKAAGFNDSLTNLKGGLSGIQMTIADVLIPILMPLIEKVTSVIKTVTEWTKANPGLTKVLLVVVGAIGGLLTVLGPLMIFLPGIISIAPMVGAAFTLMTGPVGLVIAAIAAVIAIGVLLWKNWDKVVDFAKAFGRNIVKTFTWLKDAAIGIFRKIGMGILTYMLTPLYTILTLIAKVISGIKKIPLIGAKIPGLGAIEGFLATTRAWITEHTYLPAFQHGGIVRKPTVGIIGEAGPEAVIPLGRGGGFGNVTIPIYLDGELLVSYTVDAISRKVKLQGAMP